MKKNSIKKFIISVFVVALGIAALVGCGTKKEQENGQNKTDKTIKVAASPIPHAEILTKAAEVLKEKGYELEIVEFEDYVQPNLVVESGEFDANYMQHVPYLNSFNEEQGTHLVDAGHIHYEPFGIYPGTKNRLDDIEASDSVAAQTYVNIIAVYEGNESSDKIKALISALKSDEIKEFIETKYEGAVVFYEE